MRRAGWALTFLLFLGLAAGARPAAAATPPPAATAAPTPPVAPAASGAPVVPDLAQVKDIDRFVGSDAARELLRRNGFVVLPRYYHQIFSPYIHSPLPAYVTADSLHRTYHVILEDALKELEAANAVELAELSRTLREAFSYSRRRSEELELLRDYFAVATALLERDAPPAAEAAGYSARVRRELELVYRATETAASPLLGYRLDYSRFRPRGFYTETPELARYFRAVTWYGLAGFRLSDDLQTRAALILVRTLAADAARRERWERLDRLYAGLVGPTDDLTLAEYRGALEDLERAGVAAGAPDEPARFREAARKLRDPRINSQALAADEMADWPARTKGLHLLGLRYLPDGEAFMRLTDPQVQGRGFPSGLDVLAAAGSARALARLKEADPLARTPAHAAGLQEAAAALAESRKGDAPPLYALTLDLVGTLLAPPEPRAPAFAQTEAYADKNLSSGLAVWASARHAWQLHAKQSCIYLCRMSHDEEFRGYVEPNPAFLAALQALVRRTGELLGGARGPAQRRLDGLAALLGRLAPMVEQELAGEPFTPEEVGLLDDYGEIIGRLQGFNFNADVDESCPWMALASDVHTEGASGRCLEAAVGAALPIYVAVEWRGGWHLARGAVYSYYEFQRPLVECLTDEAWRADWEAGRVPPRPGWTASFCAEFELEPLLERVRAGEKVPELLSLRDPRLDAFLAQAAAPESELARQPNYAWLLWLAAERCGRKLVPDLLRMLREAPVEVEETWEQDGQTVKTHTSGPARFAATALQKLVRPEEFPALEALALIPYQEAPATAEATETAEADEKKDRARLAVQVAAGCHEKAAEAFLLSLLERAPHPEVRWIALRALGWVGSRDVTETLLARWRAAGPQEREDLIDVLGLIWDADRREYEMPMDPALPSTADAATLRRAEARLTARLLLLLRQPADPPATGWMLYRKALEMAGRMRLAVAVPVIRQKIEARGFDYDELGALAAIGTDEAVELLLELSRRPEPKERIRVIEYLDHLPQPKVLARLREILDDPGEAEISGYRQPQRVADRATEALRRLFPDVVEYEFRELPRDRDARLAAWRVFLDGPGRTDQP